MLKPPATVVIGIVAVAVAVSIVVVLQWRASIESTTAGFWYDDFPFTLPDEQTVRLGGPLTQGEIDSIKQISRAELVRAFSGLRIAITDQRHAFWQIHVLRNIPPRPWGAVGRNVPISGSAYALGPLGGAGLVSFVIPAQGALHYAPPGASRQEIVQGIGRGIGRAAAHELGHAILGTQLGHPDDEGSYEFGSWDRASQYYGELRWTTAWPLLQQKFGK